MDIAKEGHMSTLATPLLEIREVLKGIQIESTDGKMPKAVLKRFIHCIDQVSDPRKEGMIEYPLTYVIVLAFLSVLGGADGWSEICAFSLSYKTKLNGIIPGYKAYKIPSDDTFRRVMGLFKPEEFQRAVTEFMVDEITQIKKILGIADNMPRLINVDGKEQKGTGRKYNTDQKVRNLQTLHVYDASNGICLASVPIDKKTNEIPTAQDILSQMELKNSIVTFDAMNTQKDTVSVIAESHGDYVGGLKGNQHLFYQEVVDLFTDEFLSEIQEGKKYYRSYTEKNHNRIEKRSYYMTTDIKWFADLKLWKNLKSFICYKIETYDLVTHKETTEFRYYISSLTDIELCSDAIRGHWSVENKLHWHLDVTFSEDGNTTMDKNSFNNLSILNKMCLSLLKLVQPQFKFGLKIIRKMIGWELVEHLTKILILLDEESLIEALEKPMPKKKSKIG
jgi:predicted transposase YbfD/YdcC